MDHSTIPYSAEILYKQRNYIFTFPETSGATIYYTISGSKPEPFQTIGPAAKSTYKYREPFRLPAGRRTVKAVAIGVYVVLKNPKFSFERILAMKVTRETVQ